MEADLKLAHKLRGIVVIVLACPHLWGFTIGDFQMTLFFMVGKIPLLTEFGNHHELGNGAQLSCGSYIN